MEKNFSMGRVIGICGRSGSGKTTVCRTFEKLGVMSIDTDHVYRELTRPDDSGMPSDLVRSIAREFGGLVIASDGSLNRVILSRAVFGDGNKDRLMTLNKITHKRILERTESMIFEFLREGASAVVVDAPALFESGFDEKCDAIICVSAPEKVLINRIMQRDSISEEAAMRRLASQMDDGELRAKSDYVIENGADSDLFSAAKEVLEKILDDRRGFAE